MLRFLFTRLILPLIVFWLIRSVLKTVMGMLRSSPGPAQETAAPRQAPSTRAGGELKKDPVCGTFVSPGAALARTVGGETVYFCSAECRDRYRA
jgi:YHS domain-containing protein